MDIPTVVTKKMLKAAMKHIEVIAKARQKGNVSCQFQMPSMNILLSMFEIILLCLFILIGSFF